MLAKPSAPAAARVLPAPISTTPPMLAEPVSVSLAAPSSARVPVWVKAPLTPDSLPPTARLLPRSNTLPLVRRLAAKPLPVMPV